MVQLLLACQVMTGKLFLPSMNEGLLSLPVLSILQSVLQRIICINLDHTSTLRSTALLSTQ